jgi:DNA mismatch repair protein MutL
VPPVGGESPACCAVPIANLMGRIRILPDNVANKIAAGEVVERPASVVKELLENSLDAGATRVRIDVEAGGKKRIHVVDDGCGMGRDDAMLAFERHATSKLREADDLLSVTTLGFRGEALPTIGAVSRLMLETHSSEERDGTRIEINGGKLIVVEEAGLPAGTSITVNDLFYNTPARRKFLRAESTELSHISSLVTHYALAFPERSFQLQSAVGDLINVPSAATLRDRVFQLLGPEALDDIVEFGPITRPLELPPGVGSAEEESSCTNVHLRGFISRPQIQKLNRNSIFLFVNRRMVRDKVLLHAIQEAYRNLMPAHCFPVALLFLELPHSEVDVNVHPAKTEVRFRQQSRVHDLIRDALREVLIAARPLPTFPQPAMPAGAQQPSNPLALDPPPVQPVAQRLEFSTSTVESLESAFPASERASATFPQSPVATRTSPLETEIEEHSSFPANTSGATTLGETSDLVDLRELRPLGQVRDSFIVASSSSGLWLIDQHAAHERVLYEKFAFDRDRGTVESQRLLMPTVLRLTPAQMSLWSNIFDEMECAGFEAEPFGQNTIAVKSVPASVRSDDLGKLLREIIETFERESRGYTEERAKQRIAASVACHSAIKINMPLDAKKMEWLIAALADTRFPMSCAHGRPTVLRYSMKEILKAFHRI